MLFRSLLIDADLRLGGLHKSFHVEQVPGLSELVVGSAELDAVLHKDVVPGLDFISAGSVVANPADLLMHPKCMDWLNRLGEMYEQVVVDSPPVLAVSDSPSLSSRMTSVFLVVREDFNALREVSESIRRIQNAGGSVAGVIYNDMKPHGAMGKAYGARYAAEAYGRSA